MGSLSALRRGSVVTIFLVFSLLSLLMLFILVVIDYVLSSRYLYAALPAVVLVALLFILLQWAISPAIVRWSLGPRALVTEQNNPWLYRTVADLSQQAGVPFPRKIWVIQEGGPNAMVFGRTVGTAEMAVTRGLLERLNQEEIRAVLAHEIGHLRHRDVIIMTWASAVPLLAYVMARLGFEALRVRGGSRGRGQAILVALAVALLSYAVYLITQLLVLHLSRTREYYADAYSAAATKDPHLLASALTKIAFGLSLTRRDSEPSGLRAFYIGDPVKASSDYRTLQDRMNRYDLDKDGQLDAYELQKALEEERRSPWRHANELFATHPPTYKRILMLEEMEEEIRQGGLPTNIYAYV